jgi:hypothetical protein
MTSFAVVIPAFNAAATISRAVRSALTQTRPPDEVIVCDDGSTDDTAQALEAFGNQILVIRQPNQGISAARNAATAAASSEFVVLLDADDEWLPNRLAAMEGLIARRPDLDIVTTDALVAYPDGSRTVFYRRVFPPEAEQDVEILRGNFIFGGAAVRRSALDRIGGFWTDVPHQTEYEGWIRLILSGSRAGLVSEPLCVYYRTPGSLSSDLLPTWLMTEVVLDRILADPELRLTPAQRSAAESLRAKAQMRIATGQSLRSLRNGDPTARTKCLHVLRDSRQTVRTRVKFGLAAASPPLARRVLRLRARRPQRV